VFCSKCILQTRIIVKSRLCVCSRSTRWLLIWFFRRLDFVLTHTVRKDGISKYCISSYLIKNRFFSLEIVLFAFIYDAWLINFAYFISLDFTGRHHSLCWQNVLFMKRFCPNFWDSIFNFILDSALVRTSCKCLTQGLLM